jgi:hypothetical protein
MALRAAGGVLVVLSFILYSYNILATLIVKPAISKPSEPEKVLQKAPAEAIS